MQRKMQNGHTCCFQFSQARARGLEASNMWSEPVAIEKTGRFDKLAFGAADTQLAYQQENRNGSHAGSILATRRQSLRREQRSLHKHAVPVGIEPLTLADSMFIGGKHSLTSRKRGDQHGQS